jgi:hypothetical protein
MASDADLGAWRGTALLRHLTEGLEAGRPYLDLSAHSVCTLVRRRSYLLGDDPDRTRELGNRIAQLLDSNPDLSAQARQELEHTHFAIRMVRESLPRRTSDG